MAANNDNDIDEQLIKAVTDGNADEVKRLIDAGANVNHENRYYATALMEASWKGHTEIVKILLEEGAGVDLQDDMGVTALILAAEAGHKEIVEALLQAGANPNIEDNQGYTAFDTARDEIKEIIWSRRFDKMIKSAAKTGAKTGGDYYHKYLKYKTKYINLRDRQNP